MHFDRKKLTQAGAFPITLQHDELKWKLSLGYDVQSDKFILFVNDVPFLELPFRSEVAPSGPQNITNGEIKLNEVKVRSVY